MRFRDLDSLLIWAYGLEGRQILQRNTTFDLASRRLSGSTPRTSRWSAWDKHAAAAQVRAQVDRLGYPLREYAVSMYAHRPQALQALAPELGPIVHQAAPNKGDVLGATSEILRQYASAGAGRGGIGPVRAALKCRKTTALAIRSRVFDWLDGYRLRLYSALTPLLADYLACE